MRSEWFFIWTNLNPIHPRSLVEIGPVVLEKIFEFHQYVFAIRNYLPLEKGGALHLNKLESSSPKDWNWSNGSGEKDENVKSLSDNANNDNNDDRQRTNLDLVRLERYII